MNSQTIDFAQLIRSSECGGLNLDFQSQLVNQLKEEFTDEEQTWFVANFYVYLQYHPIREFPIKLENVWNLIGFATKANAKRTLKNNFIEGEDFKVSLLPKENGKFTEEDVLISGESLLIPTDEQKNCNENRGGHNEETILLNVDTFKNLCMITKTEKSKKIRKYYIKLEGLFNGLVNQQRKEFQEKMKLLEEETKEKEREWKTRENSYKFQLKEKDKKIDRVLRDKAAIQNRKYADHPPSQVVYVYKNGPGFEGKRGPIKIGQTTDLSEREKSYMALNKTGKFLFKSDVLNCKLSERVCHHLLDKYRINSKEEWFNIDDQLAIDTVKVVTLFMDSFMQSTENFIPAILPVLQKLNRKYVGDLEDADEDAVEDADEDADKDADEDAVEDADEDADKDAVEDADKDADEDAVEDTDEDTVEDAVEDADKDAVEDADEDAVEDAVEDTDEDTVEDAVEDAADHSLKYEPPIAKMTFQPGKRRKLPVISKSKSKRENWIEQINFTKFLDEMCIVGDNLHCLKEEIRLAYRIWGKTAATREVNSQFIDFINSKFKSGVEFYGEMRRNVFRGLSLKPLEYRPDNPDSQKQYEKFILENCEVGYNNRISYIDFFNAYENWLKSSIDNQTRNEIKKYLETKFASGRVHLSSNSKTTHLHGVWGLSLKGFNGTREKKSTRKTIVEICNKTDKEQRRWSSLIVASEVLGIPKSTLSTCIRFKRLVDGKRYVYED